MSYIVCCPNCGEYIEIIQLNCGIFRHGIFKDNMKQINPHESKDKCDYYVKHNLIYGCGKPFRIIYNQEIKKCDYI